MVRFFGGGKNLKKPGVCKNIEKTAPENLNNDHEAGKELLENPDSAETLERCLEPADSSDSSFLEAPPWLRLRQDPRGGECKLHTSGKLLGIRCPFSLRSAKTFPFNDFTLCAPNLHWGQGKVSGWPEVGHEDLGLIYNPP